jgi:excisionase family DNA binding protein
MTDDSYFTYETAAAYVHLSETTLREAVRAQQLVAVRIGRSVRFTRTDLDAYMRMHRAEPKRVERRAATTSTLSPAERMRAAARAAGLL